MKITAEHTHVPTTQSGGFDDLTIPEPSPTGDIRPNPVPIAAPGLTLEDPQPPAAMVIKPKEFHDRRAPETRKGSRPAPSIPPRITKDEETSHKTPTSAGAPASKFYAFMGASGGTGVTTLCIQLAYEIASQTHKTKSLQRHIEPSVCIIDLDFETGACASYIDVPPSLEISDITGPADRIDTSLVQALMSTHECGVSVLSTPNCLGANSLANPETVLAILDAASQLYDHVILDLPRIWQPWIAAAIAGADHFAIVSELTIPSLHTTRSRIQNIETVLPNVTCDVVLNKVERRSFRNSLRLSDAEKALKRPISGAICVDYDTAREAINCGQAVGMIRPEARFVKDVKSLSQKWIHPEKKAGFFKKDRRKKRLRA